jgi:lysophospholipase L1-like esterase
MKLYGYGDSWTAGEGSSTDKSEWEKFSYIKLLGDKLNIPSINYGISGNSNQKIFNKVVADVKERKIKSDDLVIVMWSSSLRDTVSFLPNDEWISWSVKHLMNLPDKFVYSTTHNDETYDKFINQFKMFFISDLFNQNYYNIVNQNYILFTQKLFEYYGIKYVMCDSIERMVMNVIKQDDKGEHIDKKRYWNYGSKTFRELLFEHGGDVWEHPNVVIDNKPSLHPNRNGYSIIFDELDKFISKL